MPRREHINVVLRRPPDAHIMDLRDPAVMYDLNQERIARGQAAYRQQVFRMNEDEKLDPERMPLFVDHSAMLDDP